MLTYADVFTFEVAQAGISRVILVSCSKIGSKIGSKLVYIWSRAGWYLSRHSGVKPHTPAALSERRLLDLRRYLRMLTAAYADVC